MTGRTEMSRRYSRRVFLGGLVGLTGLLTACGGSGSTSRTSTALPGGGGTAAATTSPAGMVGPSPTGARYANEAMLADASVMLATMNGTQIVAFMPQQDYENGHIEGAVRIDWPDLELSDTSTDAAIQKWQQQTEQKLSVRGLSVTDRIVGYDGGTLFSARLWWVLEYLGQKQKQVLNGGSAAWENDGGQLTKGPVNRSATTYSGTANPSVLAALPEVKSSLNQPDVLFIDARSPGEYADGHIPGAVNLQYTQNAIDGTPPYFKPQEDLRQMYTNIGATADKLIIPYCSTGVRSAVTYFTLRLIGYDKVKLFSGSWSEWTSHPDLPIEK